MLPFKHHFFYSILSSKLVYYICTHALISGARIVWHSCLLYWHCLSRIPSPACIPVIHAITLMCHLSFKSLQTTTSLTLWWKHVMLKVKRVCSCQGNCRKSNRWNGIETNNDLMIFVKSCCEVPAIFHFRFVVFTCRAFTIYRQHDRQHFHICSCWIA